MLKVVATLMEHGHWLIKGLTFDAHHSHRFLKEALFGAFDRLREEELRELPFWSSIEYQDLPRHCLPRLPLRIPLFQDESIWCLAGSCTLAYLGHPWPIFSYSMLQSDSIELCLAAVIQPIKLPLRSIKIH